MPSGFFQTTSKIKPKWFPRFLEITLKKKTTDPQDSFKRKVSPKFFQNYFKNQTQRIPKSLSNYFRNKTKGVLEIL